MKNKENPKITTNGVVLLGHEMATVIYLQNNLGMDIELIPPSHAIGVKRPDFIMNGIMWEMKAPVVGTKKAGERLFFEATNQSANLIMDLRNVKGDDRDLAGVLERCFRTTRKVRSLYIITKNGELKHYKK